MCTLPGSLGVPILSVSQDSGAHGSSQEAQEGQLTRIRQCMWS